MAETGEKVELRGYVDSRLREIVVADAQKHGVPVSEAVAKALAIYYNRHDLAAVPRKPIGRPMGMKMEKASKKVKKTGKR